jgi:hypothetical protein
MTLAGKWTADEDLHSFHLLQPQPSQDCRFVFGRQQADDGLFADK